MIDDPSHGSRTDRKQDEAVRESFPARDPPASSGVVGPGGAGTHASDQPRRPPDEPQRGRDQQRHPQEPQRARRGEQYRPQDRRGAEPTGQPTSDRYATETTHIRENQATPSNQS